MLFLQLFASFFLIGLLGFGGGYGMLPLIQGEVVTAHGWMTMGEFTDIVAISQMTPGPIGINSATYCGFMAAHNAGYGWFVSFLGSLVSTLALVLPSFMLMMLMAMALKRYMQAKGVQDAFMGLRPAVVGLLAATVLMLLTPDNFGAPGIDPWRFSVSCFLFLATLAGVWHFKVNPIRMLCYCGVAGLVLLY